MSIYVFITHKSEPLQETARRISVEEWTACVRDKPGFRAPLGDEAKWLGKHARIWAEHEYPVAFDFVDGDIWVKSPDAATVVRMKLIAESLNASVFSETGELFGDHGMHDGFLPGYP